MPIHRDPNSGDIHEVPTKLAGERGNAHEERTKPVGKRGDNREAGSSSANRASEGQSAYDAKTVKAGHSSRANAPNNDSDDAKTRIYRGARKTASAREASAPANSDENISEGMEDPLAGWIVVTHGPGQGNFIKLGYGSNSIGRDPTERVSLAFGDQQISRTQHAVITYDPRGRKFYIQHGGGTNLTYVNDEPVLSPTILEPMAEIQIADTTLRFVPFCSEQFDWHELDG